MVPEKVFPKFKADLNREQFMVSSMVNALEAIESMRATTVLHPEQSGKLDAVECDVVYGRVGAYDDLIELLNKSLSTAHKLRAERLSQNETGILPRTSPATPLGLLVQEMDIMRQSVATLRPTLGPMPEATVSIDRTQILEMAKDWSARMVEQFRDHEDLKPNPRNIEAVFRHFEDLVTKPAPVAADADGGQ